MITKFGSLFAGHVDFEDMGLEATPVNDRWLSDQHIATVFDKSEAMAKLMDRAGYDTFWLAEHHFQREGYECIPNILMLAIHLCHITERLKIGSGFNIAPMWHPLRLAEDYATADILTGGRVIFGVGRGYHTREVEVFGAPMLDGDANRELFEEQVDIIFKSFNERSFSHHGKHYDIPPRVPYRGYELEEISSRPASRHPARRVLAAHRQRQPARTGLYGQARDQGHNRRRRGPRRRQLHRRRGLEGYPRPPRQGDRARRRPAHKPLVPPGGHDREGHRGGEAPLRGEP